MKTATPKQRGALKAASNQALKLWEETDIDGYFDLHLAADCLHPNNEAFLLDEYMLLCWGLPALPLRMDQKEQIDTMLKTLPYIPSSDPINKGYKVGVYDAKKKRIKELPRQPQNSEIIQ